jgi:uncharacterized protein (TIGR00369 family)
MTIASCAADSALVYSVMSALPIDQTSSTVRMDIHLLAGPTLDTCAVCARAEVVQIVGDKGLSRAEITAGDGVVIGHAMARCQVLSRSIDIELASRERPPVKRREPGPGRRLSLQSQGHVGTNRRYLVGEVSDLANAVGVMHGGAIATLLTESAAMTAQDVSPMGAAARAVDLDITFIRPVALDAQERWLECSAVQIGRRSTTIDSVLWSGTDMCALARVGFVADRG